LTAEVFAEFVQAIEEEELAVAVAAHEFRGVEVEAEQGEDMEDAFSDIGVEESDIAGVERIESDTDGDGIAVGELVIGGGFEFMGAPVSEVEGAGGSGFEGVTAGGDVLDVEFGAAVDEGFDEFELAVAEVGGVLFDPGEEAGIADEGHLEAFDAAGAEVMFGEGLEEFEIVDNGGGWGEGADEVLFTEEVDTVFDAYAGVGLGEGGGGEAEVAAAAVGGGGGEADDIEQRAAAEGEDPGVAIDASAMDFLVERVEDGGVVFGGFAAGYDEGWSGEVELWFVLGEVLAGFVEDTRVVYGESAVYDQ
jgi:hypothetical protein